MTYHELAAAAATTLERAGISPDTAKRDADLLARHVLAWDQATWLTHRSDSVGPDFSMRYAALIARRERREPVAYIRGVQEFWGRDFLVSPAVLIPRPDTELLIEVARTFLATHPEARVADIGTGSGCIAITLAAEFPGIEMFATDVSRPALSVARDNAARLGVADRVQFVETSYLDGVPGPLDLIVSNPPYVVESDAGGLSPEVAQFEPATALFGGSDGLRDIRLILSAAAGVLSEQGWVACEIGYDQTDSAAREVAAAHLEPVAIHDDLQGIPRVVVAKRR